MWSRRLLFFRPGNVKRTAHNFHHLNSTASSSPKKRMPSIMAYFKYNPSAPVIFLVAWSLSLLGGLVMEKNRYEDMRKKGERHIQVLKNLISRVEAGEKDINIDEELALVNDSSRSVDEILQDIENFDKEWSSSIEQQQYTNNENTNNETKSRKDVRGKFV